MAMDPKFRICNGSMSGANFNDDTISVLSDVNHVNGFTLEHTSIDRNLVDPPLFSPDPNPSNLVTGLVSHQGEFCEDSDFNDVVLNYIDQILMEEDMEEKNCMFQESWAALQAAEKSFYEVIGEKYPPSPKDQFTYDQNFESPDENYGGNYSECNTSSCYGSNNSEDPWWNCNFGEDTSGSAENTPADWTLQSSFSLLRSSEPNIADGFVDSQANCLWDTDVFSQSETGQGLSGGVDEASNFLPSAGGAFANLNENVLLHSEPIEEAENVVVDAEKHGSGYSMEGSKGRKNLHLEDVDLESERSTKQSAVYTESTVRTEMFDMMLLGIRENGIAILRDALQNRISKNMQQNGQLKASNGRKNHGKKRGVRRNVVDLRTLLMLCAQAFAADDRRTADELLVQIRQHSSPTGDGMQRLAYYFANGLETRIAGSRTQFNAVPFGRASAADILKAHYLFLAVCPYSKLASFFSNKTIMQVAEKATRLHIIDFGISYGFQWPSFIEQLSSRPGGPPKLRITGVDFPLPGFKPAEKIEETGHRLANYAQSFKVPFEFNALAKKWETIQMDDIKFDTDEVLVVNCLFRLKCLLDESVMLESPKDIVLRLIRKMNPNVFILGIVNAAYGVPFFGTRFREALFHYSALFDMFETIVPRDIPERMLVEKEMQGVEIMNILACEGSARIERPETYKQWQIRNQRAGFRQLPLNKEIVRIGKEWVTSSGYHKDFVVDVDGQWLLQGWKGRIMNGLSSWEPVH
ncbi:scarecrow-like protein 14 [Malania oleifera]|uniref:scarecrow-like protein 14 n=1 Tax=Malania oleifera TaxID=397392 RepID=UPI0025ADB1F2|nr:scarecrow-like protein 14 [Malania oleifera]